MATEHPCSSAEGDEAGRSIVKPIPISAAKKIAEAYGYDQVVIIARAIDQGEHVTTYGKDKENCDVAAKCGDFLKFKVMGWASAESETRE